MTSDQNSKNIENPNQAAKEAQTEIADKKHYSGGSAFLDTQVETGRQTDVEAMKPVIATNITENREEDDPARAKVFTTSGNYPPDFERIDDEGELSQVKDNPGAE